MIGLDWIDRVCRIGLIECQILKHKLNWIGCGWIKNYRIGSYWMPTPNVYNGCIIYLTHACWNDGQIRLQLDDAIASDCPFCGDLMIREISSPFILPEEAQQVASWEIKPHNLGSQKSLSLASWSICFCRGGYFGIYRIRISFPKSFHWHYYALFHPNFM